jgi:asparagine synthase (glutamine-hydrolysing)
MREAMRGVLPEVVRTMRTKTAISGRVRWSLVRERGKVEGLLRDPILAQMGAIEPEPLRRAIDVAVNGDDRLLFGVLRPLSLETWLRARVGRPLL